MKILHITNSYAPIGGAERYLIDVCYELEKRNHENVVIYGSKDKATLSQDIRKCFFIERIACFDCPEKSTEAAISLIKEQNPNLIYLHIINNIFLMGNIVNLKPVIQYVHNHDLYYPAYSEGTRIFRVPAKFGVLFIINCLLGNCIGCKPFYALKQFTFIKKKLHITKRFKALIVASEYMKNCLISNGLDKSKIHVSPYFTYLNEKPIENINRSTKIILFAGRVCKAKGLEYLLKAIRHVKIPHKLIVAGDGYFLNSVKNLAMNLRIDKNVEFLGWLNKEELGSYYEQASVVVVPSVWPEPFGITGIEAMSYGKPIIAFGTGGIGDWLTDQVNGFIVKPKDVYTLADKISRILEDAHLGNSLGKKGKKIVQERFSPQKHTDLLEKIIMECK